MMNVNLKYKITTIDGEISTENEMTARQLMCKLKELPDEAIVEGYCDCDGFDSSVYYLYKRKATDEEIANEIKKEEEVHSGYRAQRLSRYLELKQEFENE